MVGRDQELDFLAERLQAARSGDGQLLVVAGEPGIGKTRLLAEFSARARADGWLVLSGAAYETEGMPPYLPFAEALRGYIRVVPDEDLASVIAGVKTELALLMPELRDRLQDVQPSAAQSSDADRYQLFERVSNFLLGLARTSESRGLLLCLDDLHWADRSTLLLLHHLARKLKGVPLLVAGSYRTQDVDPTRPFFTLLADLARERLDERLSLEPLSLEQASELMQSAGLEVSQGTVEAIYRQTQGNPFYLEEVLRHLQAEDLLDTNLDSANWAIPEGVRQVIGKRVLGLRTEARRLLQAGAVLGDGFQFEIAGAMSEVEEQVLMDALDQAIGAGLLREEGDVCRFGHPLIQRTVYDSLTAARRRALHLRAAEVIEATYGRHLEPYLSRLAVNYRLAGARADPDKAIEYSILAGASAEKALAYDEAHTHWASAIQLMERYAVDPRQRAELLARLGDLLQVTGFDTYAESARDFKQAIDLYQEVGAREEAASVQARLGLLLGAGGPVNDNGAALKYLHAAEEFLKDGPPSEAQLWLYSGLGLVDVWRVQPEEGLRASRRAMELALQLERHDRWVTNAIMCGFHLHAMGKLSEGIGVMTHAWEKADEIDQTYPAYVAASWLGGRLRELGDPREGESWYAREVGQRRQDEAPSRRRALWSGIATSKAVSGDMEGCRKVLADQHVPAREEAGFWLGDWEQSATGWARIRNVAPKAEHQLNLAEAGLALARLASAKGEPAKAIELLTEVLEIGLQGPHVILQMRAGVDLAVRLAEVGEIDHARRHLQSCVEILRQGEDWRGLAGRVSFAEAILAVANRDFTDAEAHFNEALGTFRQYSLPWEEAEAYRVWGGALPGAGRRYRQAARDSFDKALDIYGRLEAAPVWADSLLDSRGSQLGSPKRGEVPNYPDGLTEREVEVIRLIATGQSNRDMADSLVLSMRTVERHIANVYDKIGMRTKAQTTAYAIAKGLLEPTTAS
ncbi:MAG TPA: AAA family ATPase [Dehalococcoidia bacterium]|nr:AAA family ATPase [Dehalococcoidia bacterium]